MTEKEIKTIKEEKKALYDSLNVVEKHSFDIRPDKPYKGNNKKQNLFMDMVRKIKDVHIVEWNDTFMIEITHLKTWGEVRLFINYEINKCFKATERAYEELR